MRINKYIGESGKASRRGADRLVNEGRVTINGELAALGSVVGKGDDVRIDDVPVYVETEKVYMALNNRSVSRVQPIRISQAILST